LSAVNILLFFTSLQDGTNGVPGHSQDVVHHPTRWRNCTGFDSDLIDLTLGHKQKLRAKLVLLSLSKETLVEMTVLACQATAEKP
jgi:16S rRNA C1402 N4-methylase RsmH